MNTQTTFRSCSIAWTLSCNNLSRNSCIRTAVRVLTVVLLHSSCKVPVDFSCEVLLLNSIRQLMAETSEELPKFYHGNDLFARSQPARASVSKMKQNMLVFQQLCCQSEISDVFAHKLLPLC